MDLRRFVFPPIVVAAIALLLYGFDAFNSFSFDSVTVTSSERAVQRAAIELRPNRRSETTRAAPPKVESTDAIGTQQIVSVTSATLVPPTAAFGPADSAVPTNVATLPMNRAAAASSSTPIDEVEENLTEIANDSFTENEEPLIAVSPSMAAQATPVEMSDDGQIDPETPENAS